jgi:O-antigen ligase
MAHPPFYDIVQQGFFLLMFLMILAGIPKPKFLVYAYLIVMLFRPGQVSAFLGSIRFELLIVILIAVRILISGSLKKNFALIQPISKATFIFFGVALISIVQSFDIISSYNYAYTQLFPLIVFFSTMLAFFEKEEDLRLLIYLYLIIIAYLAWLPIFNHFAGIGHERHGAGILHSVGETYGAAGHVGLANAMTQSLPFAYFVLLKEKSYFKKAAACFLVGIYFLGVISSGSRGGFLGLIICIVLFAYKADRKFLTLAIILPAFIAGMAIVSREYLEWMKTILDFGSSDLSASSRFDGLRHGVEMAVRRPILGVGIGCYALARSAWFHWGIWAHNLYGELIGELGLLGLLSWGWFIYLCLRETKRIKSFVSSRTDVDAFYGNLADACSVTLILRLIIGMTTHSLMAYIWYMIAGMLILASKIIGTKYPEYNLTKNLGKVHSA